MSRKQPPRRGMGSRKDDEAPPAIASYGWRYHHLGIPTDKQHPGERYLEAYKTYVSGFKESPYGIEWMRFESDSPVSELIRTVPHIAFEVDDLDAALVGKQVFTPPNSPSPGVRVAMIVDDGAVIELIEFQRKARRAGRKASAAGRKRQRSGRS